MIYSMVLVLRCLYSHIGLYRDSFGEENYVCIWRKGKVKLSFPELLTILFILQQSFKTEV